MENEIAIKTQEGIVDFAQKYVKQNNIILGKNYDFERAMNSLYLNLIQVKDKNNVPALESCSEVSIKEAIMECVNKELDVSKDQGYFIPYGKTLKFHPSYFGLSKMARDVAGVVINSIVIRDGEEADMEARIDGTLIIHHKPSIKCLNNKIIAVYAVATDISTGRVVNSDIMSMEEIQKTLLASQTGGLTAKKYPHEMSRKVVERRLAKHIINKSDSTTSVYITNPDGGVTKIKSYDELLDEDNMVDFSYTINTDEQIEKEKEKYEPKEDDVITADDLKLDEIEPNFNDDIPENAFEIDYNEVKGGKNRDKYKIIQGTFNKQKYTCMVIPVNNEEG